jgi:hypothetical protein
LKKLCLPPHDTRIWSWLYIQSVVPLELVDHGLLELGGAVHRGVLGEAGVNRGDGRVLDVIGCVEIRLTGAESDDILALGTECLGAGCDGQGGGWFDGLNARGELDGHRRSSLVWLW